MIVAKNRKSSLLIEKDWSLGGRQKPLHTTVWTLCANNNWLAENLDSTMVNPWSKYKRLTVFLKKWMLVVIGLTPTLFAEALRGFDTWVVDPYGVGTNVE